MNARSKDKHQTVSLRPRKIDFPIQVRIALCFSSSSFICSKKILPRIFYNFFFNVTIKKSHEISCFGTTQNEVGSIRNSVRVVPAAHAAAVLPPAVSTAAAAFLSSARVSVVLMTVPLPAVVA